MVGAQNWDDSLLESNLYIESLKAMAHYMNGKVINVLNKLAYIDIPNGKLIVDIHTREKIFAFLFWYFFFVCLLSKFIKITFLFNNYWYIFHKSKDYFIISCYKAKQCGVYVEVRKSLLNSK